MEPTTVIKRLLRHLQKHGRLVSFDRGAKGVAKVAEFEGFVVQLHSPAAGIAYDARGRFELTMRGIPAPNDGSALLLVNATGTTSPLEAVLPGSSAPRIHRFDAPACKRLLAALSSPTTTQA